MRIPYSPKFLTVAFRDKWSHTADIESGFDTFYHTRLKSCVVITGCSRAYSIREFMNKQEITNTMSSTMTIFLMILKEWLPGKRLHLITRCATWELCIAKMHISL